VLARLGSGTLAFTDLLRSEPASANAAAPTRRCACRNPGHRLLIGTPGPHEFATTLRTLSLNHRLTQSERVLVRLPVTMFDS